jgi:L-iditol 2-dehydrogenase
LRALRFYGPGDLRLEDIERPEPAQDEVLAQVEVALTDGTDLKAFRRGHPVLFPELPSPFGHEFCGIDVATGRRVVAANSNADGTPGAQPLFLNGAFAELVLVPEPIARVNLLRVPERLAPEVAAMVEPLACCLRGVEIAGIEAGQDVAVLGTGPIGLMLCAAVTDAGGRAIAVGGRPERRALAPEFGARAGDAEGADVVIEATGSEQGWRDAIALARPGGTVLFFGGLERGTAVAVDTYRLHYEELTLRGAFHHTPRHVRAALVFLASGAYPWERLITHRVRLEDVPALLADPPRELLKAAIYP